MEGSIEAWWKLQDVQLAIRGGPYLVPALDAISAWL